MLLFAVCCRSAGCVGFCRRATNRLERSSFCYIRYTVNNLYTCSCGLLTHLRIYNTPCPMSIQTAVLSDKTDTTATTNYTADSHPTAHNRQRIFSISLPGAPLIGQTAIGSRQSPRWSCTSYSTNDYDYFRLLMNINT